MATIQSLATDVYVHTNRPDLVTETAVAIRKAIRKFHGAELFKRDLKSVRLNMSTFTPLHPNQYRWSIDLTEFPQFRRFKSVNYPMDLIPPAQIPAPMYDYPLGFTQGRTYEEISPDNLFNLYGKEKINYFMVVGTTVTIKSGWYIDFLDFAYYSWPVIPVSSTTTLDSWIVDVFPEAIVEEAASIVFKMIGKDDEYQRFNQMFNENMSIIATSDIGEGN